MPWKTVKIGNKFRVVKADTGKIAMNAHGTPLDGGGHDSKHEAQQQVKALYANEPEAKKSAYASNRDDYPTNIDDRPRLTHPHKKSY